MPKYRYTAIDTNGKQKTGRIEASSEDEVNAKLSQQGLMVSALATMDGGKGKEGGKKGITFNFGKVVKTEALAVFTRQLATLLQAGLPLLPRR